MNILVIYPFLLHSAVRHGSGVRLLALLHALHCLGHKIYLLSISEVDPTPHSKHIDELKDIYDDIKVVSRQNLSFFHKILYFLMPGPPAHIRDLVNREAIQYVERVTSTGEVDLVYLIFTVSGEYIRAIDHSKTKIILDADNFESRFYAVIRNIKRSPLQKLADFLRERKVRSYETNLFQKVDRIVPITQEEKFFIEKMVTSTPITVLPPFVDTLKYKSIQPLKELNSLLFIGSFTNLPNTEAMKWFCQSIMPHILVRIPSAKLYIIGNYSKEAVSELGSLSVEVVGAVDDIRPWMEKCSVFISPVRLGGGIRLKNIDALLAGRPLVTTSLGAEGLGNAAGSAYLVADDPHEFAEKVIILLQDPKLQNSIGQAGRLLAERIFDHEMVLTQLDQLLLQTKSMDIIS